MAHAENMHRFRDRRDAGVRLARALEHLRGRDVLVLALPRGGVPVAFEVAKALEAELDIVVARKLGAPGQPEFGVGAIASHARVLDHESLRALGLVEDDIAEVERAERAELERRRRRYQQGREPPQARGRTVVVVDDGVATGVTARAALRSVRAEQPARVLFAAPVGPADAADALKPDADEVVLLVTPTPFQAVGLWYEDFAQTSDEEVLALLAQARPLRRRPHAASGAPATSEVQIASGRDRLEGTLTVPQDALGLVVFAHGSGSSRFSPRNRYVADVLHQRGLATLLLDLLTQEEEEVDIETREHRFDIGLLAARLADAARWAKTHQAVSRLHIGFFGSSTGGAAALVAAGELPESVHAVVSRGGRPDLARESLGRVRAPTLLLVGELDHMVVQLNEAARELMAAPVELRLVKGATHLFEEPGALEEVAGAAADFFAAKLAPSEDASARGADGAARRQA